MENENSRPSNHLIWAILCTLLCCLPFGIAAIIYAARVDKLYDTGNISGAQAASKMARNLTLFGILSVLIIDIIIAILRYLGFLKLPFL